MKKCYFILLFIFLLLGCNKNSKNLNQKNIVIDSVVYYLNEFQNNNLSDINKLKLNNKAFQLNLAKKNTLNKRKNLDKITNNYFILNEWDKYNKTSKILLDISTSENDSLYIANSMRYIGNYYYKNKILDSSFYFYLKSEKIYFQLKDQENYSVVLLKKGIVQLDNNDFLAADISLRKAYNILKSTNDYQRIYATLNSLGTVSTELKEYEKAVNNYEKAIELIKKTKIETKEHQIANCLNNLGIVYKEKKDFKKAIYYFKKALLEENLKNDNPELYSIILDNLAYTKFKSNNFRDLTKIFFEAISIRDSLKDSTSKVLIYNHLSEYYFKIENFNKASEYSKKALNFAYKSKTPSYIITSLKQAAIVDKKNAFKFSFEYIKLSDSLQLIERNSRNLFARIQLETDEIIQQKDQLVEKNRNILNYFIGAILIGVLLFFVRTQRSRSRELVLKQSQQQANEEIYRLIISHQNQLEEGRDLEKRRLSKELHDGVLGRLFGLRLNLDGLNSSDDESSKKQRLEYLSELQLIEQDLRDISHELNRENLVLINNFVAIINNLLEQQAKINPAKIKSIIEDDIDWEIVPNTSKINLYRILQEALQNINKHAEAKNITIHFRKDKKGNLLFNIEDDGNGYDMNSKKSKGIGMKNIVSRTQQCNGIIDIKSEIGKGSKIIITFPLENKTIKV